MVAMAGGTEHPVHVLTAGSYARCPARLYPGVFLYFSGAFS
jgi:hypothetical protein